MQISILNKSTQNWSRDASPDEMVIVTWPGDVETVVSFRELCDFLYPGGQGYVYSYNHPWLINFTIETFEGELLEVKHGCWADDSPCIWIHKA